MHRGEVLEWNGIQLRHSAENSLFLWSKLQWILVRFIDRPRLGSFHFSWQSLFLV